MRSQSPARPCRNRKTVRWGLLERRVFARSAFRWRAARAFVDSGALEGLQAGICYSGETTRRQSPFGSEPPDARVQTILLHTCLGLLKSASLPPVSRGSWASTVEKCKHMCLRRPAFARVLNQTVSYRGKADPAMFQRGAILLTSEEQCKAYARSRSVFATWLPRLAPLYVKLGSSAGANTTEVPTAIFLLRLQLQSFTWTDSSLLVLPENFCQLQALRKLQISRGQLQEIPASFGALSALEDLDLSHNKLEVIPSSIGELVQLR